MSRFNCCNYTWVWIGFIVFITQLLTTINYSAIGISTLCISPLHTRWYPQSSLVLSWQRISTRELYQTRCKFKLHEVFFSQYNLFFAISFQSFDCHPILLTTHSVSDCPDFNILARTTWKRPLLTILLLLRRCVYPAVA
jgi:hypothetical protein